MTNNNVNNSVVKDYIFDAARFCIVDKINDVDNNYFVTREFASQIDEYENYKLYKKEIRNMLDIANEVYEIASDINKSEAIAAIKAACKDFHSGSSKRGCDIMESYYKITPHFLDCDFSILYGFDIINKEYGDDVKWYNDFIIDYKGNMPWMEINTWKRCCAALIFLGNKEITLSEHDVYPEIPSPEEIEKTVSNIREKIKTFSDAELALGHLKLDDLLYEELKLRYTNAFDSIYKNVFFRDIEIDEMKKRGIMDDDELIYENIWPKEWSKIYEIISAWISDDVQDELEKDAKKNPEYWAADIPNSHEAAIIQIGKVCTRCVLYDKSQIRRNIIANLSPKGLDKEKWISYIQMKLFNNRF